MSAFSWIFARLSEPSTYAGFGLIINAVTGAFANGVPQTSAGWVNLLGQLVVGVVAAVKKEAAAITAPPPAA